MSSTVQTASHIIYIASGTTYALNGTTGNIDYSGTNSQTVIQDAISALSSGGKILLRNGTYTLSGTTPLTMSNANVTLEGEGYGTEITLSASPQHVISVTAGFCVIRSLQVNGNQLNVTSLINIAASDSIVSQVWLINSKGHCLEIDAEVQRVQVMGCYFSTAGNRGVNIPNTGSVYNVDTSITGCYFEQLTGFGVGAVFCQNLVIADNVFVGAESGQTPANREPINLDSCQQCSVVGNVVRQSPDSGIVIDNDSGGDSIGIAVTGNTVIGSYYEGIYVVTSDSGGVTYKVSISGTISRNNGQVNYGQSTLADHAGILVEAKNGPVSDCVVVANCCSDDQPSKTQVYGICEHDPSSYNVTNDLIIGNDCIGNASATADIVTASSSNGTKLAW